MKYPPKDPKVKSFTSDLQDIDPPKMEIVVALFQLFMDKEPLLSDKFIYGGIGLYLGDQLIGGVWVSKNHVSLVFTEGHKLEDKHDVLEGAGKFRRHIKIGELSEIKSKSCAFYIENIIDLYS